MYRSKVHRGRPPPNSITMRLVITTLSSLLRLTLLESSSPESSACPHEDEVPPLDEPCAVAQLSDAVQVVSPPSAHAEEHLGTTESSQGTAKFKNWFHMRTKKNNKDSTSHKPGRVARKSHRPADPRAPSQSPARVDATNVGPSRMAAGQRVPVSTLL